MCDARAAPATTAELRRLRIRTALFAGARPATIDVVPAVVDRVALSRKADEARRRGRYRRAITAYQRLLADDPSDASVHGKLAPLLARRGRLDDALASFVAAAEEQVRRGFTDKALGIYQQAVRSLPRESSLWLAMAQLHVARARRADAVSALLRGAERLATRRDRPKAEPLLRRALELEPTSGPATLALAVVLRRLGNRAEARELLDGLVARSSGPTLVRARRAIFRMSPTPANLWRWLTTRG
jgi:tetratricopeptide (TPR) repeat protein